MTRVNHKPQTERPVYLCRELLLQKQKGKHELMLSRVTFTHRILTCPNVRDYGNCSLTIPLESDFLLLFISMNFTTSGCDANKMWIPLGKLSTGLQRLPIKAGFLNSASVFFFFLPRTSLFLVESQTSQAHSQL